MQTNFTAEQLADPDIKEADRILRRCVHCGLCTSVCSSYVVLGDERDSPRGRIYLIKDMLEREPVEAPTTEIRTHLDRCLTCLSCTSTCPSGVDYMHLVDIARSRIEKRLERPFRDRMLRTILASVLTSPRRFSWALKAAPLGRPFAGLLRRFGMSELAAMIELAPKSLLAPSARFSGPGTAATKAERRARVVILTGCVQPVLRPDINDATIRLLARRGVDVVVANGAGCCGAVVQHLGRNEEAKRLARRNIDAWMNEKKKGNVDAVIVNASGCGTMVKDYGHLLKDDPAYAGPAKEISSIAKDISEFLTTYELGAPLRWTSIRVAYHSACSLQHGQRIHDEPRTLLKNAGFTVSDVADGHLCCGSAGTYSILEPDISSELRSRKVRNIRATRADVVAAGNIGCITHLQDHIGMPIVHTVELLDWTYGGPVPRGLEHLEPYVTDVPKPRREINDFIDAEETQSA